MRILHLVHQYLPDHVGGTELYTHWLAREQARRGHQVSVFHRRSAEGAGWEPRADGDVQVWAAWSGPLRPTRRFLATFGDLPIERAFEHVLGEVRPDLVHIQHLMGLPVRLIDVLQDRGVPYVITLWDYWWVCANAQLLTNYSQRVCDGPRAFLNCARCALARAGWTWFWPAVPALAALLAWRNRLLRRVMEGAGGLIAPTPFVRRWYAAHRAPTERMRVVLPGLEGPGAGLRRGEPREGPVRFVYIGGLSWQKGVHVLVEAFAGVRGAAELWIAGDESFAPDYVSYLRGMTSSAVRFLGRLSREQVWEVLAQVDVVVVPSIWYETFSFLISEAFTAGVPVVASRLGPLADRVRDGVDGLLVPPGDVEAWRAALQRLVDEPALLERLRASVRPPVTLAEHADRLEALYAEVVDRGCGVC